MIAGINLKKPTRAVGFLRSGAILPMMRSMVSASAARTNRVDPGNRPAVNKIRRCALYAGCLALLSVVCDGWSGKPSPLVHQVMLLPFLGLFAFLLYALLSGQNLYVRDADSSLSRLPAWWSRCLILFEAWSVLLMAAEARHYRAFGYHLSAFVCSISVAIVLLVWVSCFFRSSARSLMAAVLTSVGAGMIVAIRCFPLNYLRSDMLPVIGWADGRLLRLLDPYGTMHVGNRIYDFPYLPGMLVAFWPAAYLHMDLRWATLAYLLASAFLVFWAAREGRRLEVAGLLGLFLLCPFLQYRHDLYLEPHWFTLVFAIVLMQRRRFVWSALVWGISCAIYQLSWVVYPFVLLNAYRRRGMLEVMKVFVLTGLGALVVSGPFVKSARSRIPIAPRLGGSDQCFLLAHLCDPT